MMRAEDLASRLLSAGRDLPHIDTQGLTDECALELAQYLLAPEPLDAFARAEAWGWGKNTTGKAFVSGECCEIAAIVSLALRGISHRPELTQAGVRLQHYKPVT